LSLQEWRTQWPGGIEKIEKNPRKKNRKKQSQRKNQKFSPGLGMPRKVAKQQIALACSTLVAMRLILTDDLDEENNTGMTQARETYVTKERSRGIAQNTRDTIIIFIYSHFVSDMHVFTQFNKPPVCDNANMVPLRNHD